MNAKKGFSNIAANILSQLITLALGIIIPRLVLVNLGSESNGLLNSINQVLAYVALLEAGVGTASLQALYGPIAKQDYNDINAILAATNYFYKRTGRIYFAVVLLLTFVLPFAVTTELPRSTVMWVMLLSGLPGVVNYYFQGKFRILLQAEGKSYVLTGLSAVVQICTSVSKIVLLLAGYNVIALQAMYFLFNLAQMIYIMCYIRRHYKWLDLHTAPNIFALAQSKNVLVHQIAALVFNNTDVLLITFFCGLSTVSVYSLYSMLFGMVATMITNFSGANFILGQTFHTDRKRYLKLLDIYESCNMTLTFSMHCIANIFILPFLALYTAGVEDTSYIDQYLPYLFIAIHLLSNGRASSSLSISYANHFKQTQYRSILESTINIVVSLLCVWKFGIYGVLMGTIAALLYRTNDMILYANRKILNRNPWITYRRWLLNLALFIVVTVAGKWFFSFIPLNSYVRIIGWAVVCCMVIIPFFFVVVSLCERDVFRFACELIRPYWQKMKGKCWIKA